MIYFNENLKGKIRKRGDVNEEKGGFGDRRKGF